MMGSPTRGWAFVCIRIYDKLDYLSVVVFGYRDAWNGIIASINFNQHENNE